jgi:hypothetical protein
LGLMQVQAQRNGTIHTDNLSIRWMDVSDTSLGRASSGTELSAIGKAGDAMVVSLGDGGTATLGFIAPFSAQEGPEFAVFENSFDGKFLELAFVEVSSNGTDFVRFPSISNTPTDFQTGPFEFTSRDSVYNLAGQDPANYGTTFELNDIPDTSILDKQNIRFVRIVDVVGSIDPQYAQRDSRGMIVNDPFPTPFASSGFDLDAVALLHPNYATNIHHQGIEGLSVHQSRIVNLPLGAQIKVFNTLGQELFDLNSQDSSVDLSQLNLKGLYIVQIIQHDSMSSIKLWL